MYTETFTDRKRNSDLVEAEQRIQRKKQIKLMENRIKKDTIRDSKLLFH